MRLSFLIIFFSLLLYAESINEYKITAQILNNGDVQITENITFKFDGYKHGIYRFIPLKGNESIKLLNVYKDGIPEKNEHYYKGSNFFIKIGSADKLIEGVHTYTIKYIFENVIKKHDKKHNRIAINTVGDMWQVPINNITLTIKLPKKLVNSKVEVYYGFYGSKNRAKIIKKSQTKYQAYIKNIPPHYFVTFYVIFDKNLMQNSSLFFIQKFYGLLILILGAFGFSYFKLSTPKLSIPVQYRLPDLNSLRAAYLLNEKINFKDLLAALTELAVKGYIKISNKEGELRVIKLKEGSDLDDELKLIYNTLFEDDTKSVLIDKSVKKNLYERVGLINSKLRNWALNLRFFEKDYKIKRKKFLIISYVILIPFFIYALNITKKMYPSLDVVSVIFQVIAAVMFLYFGYKTVMQKKFLSIIFGLIFIGSGLVILFENSITPLEISVFLLALPLFLKNKINIYTQKGLKKLREILGFREFIDKVKKEKLEFFLKKDPKYLDKVLPYAIVFGFTKWYEYYKEFYYYPDWYDGDLESMGSMESDFYYFESSDTDGFGSGDGAGGGSGGGGGGSW